MSLDKIVAGLDLTKIKAPSGLTYAQELVRAANLLRDCIQSRINRGSMGSCLSTADIADIKVDGMRLSCTLKVQNAIRPCKKNLFNRWRSISKRLLMLDLL